MRRWLFNLLAGLSLILLVGTVGLWVLTRSSNLEMSRDGVVSLAAFRGDVVMGIDPSAPVVIDAEVHWGDFSLPFAMAHDWHFLGFDYVYWNGSTHLLRSPIWFLTLLFLILPALWPFLWRRRRRLRAAGQRCVKCGYDLQGNPVAESCPECGAAVAEGVTA